MEKRYNYRIYPNKSQEEQIQRNFGCARFVYNYYLNKRMEAYKNGQGIFGLSDCCLDLTNLKKAQGFEWLCDADINSLQRSIRQLDTAFKAFFRNIKKENTAPGYPRFKSKKNTRKSYTSSCTKQNTYISKTTGELHEYDPSIVLGEKHIKLPKLGQVKCRVSKQAPGRILSATVKQVPSGKYYVSVLFTECSTIGLPKTGSEIGLHMGIRDLAVTSDGERLENKRYFENSKKKIAKLQRQLSRKPSGSKNHEKIRIKLAREYEHVHNQKTDYLHKLTTRLVRDYDLICVRDEQIAKTMRDYRFAKVLADVSWGEFIRQLDYKSKWYGKSLIKIDKLHPSTQLCGVCGYKNPEIAEKPKLLKWECPKCGAIHDRRINAAYNILHEGLRVFESECEIAI